MTATPIPEIAAFLKARLAHFTDREAGQIATDASLIDLGLQSIDAVLLCGDVEDHFGVDLDPASIFEHDSVDSFARYVGARLAGK